MTRRAHQDGASNRRLADNNHHPEGVLSAVESGDRIPAVHGTGLQHTGGSLTCDGSSHDEPTTFAKPHSVRFLDMHDPGQALQAPSEDVAALRRLLADVKAARSMEVGAAVRAPARPPDRGLQSTVQLLYASRPSIGRYRLPPLDPAAIKTEGGFPHGMQHAMSARLQSDGQGSARPHSSPH